MQVVDYNYSEQGRRPATVGALAASIAMIVFGATYAAPWLFMAPVALAGLMALVMVIVNRAAGMSVAGERLTLFSGGWAQDVPTTQIQSVKVKRWSDGAPTLTLVLAGAPPVDVPGYCFGSADDLIRALASRDIAIVDG